MTPASQLTPVEDEFRNASRSEIQAIERLLGSPLPNDYVTFLQRFGKSTFDGDATIAVGGNRPLGVFVMFAAGGDHCAVLADLEAHPQYVREGFVPIADDLFNNRYLLKATSGEVYFVEYLHGSSNLVKVSPSFAAFIDAIEVTPNAL